MTSRAANLLPWVALLNALLMVCIAERYVALRGEWRSHRIAVDAYVGGQGEAP